MSRQRCASRAGAAGDDENLVGPFTRSKTQTNSMPTPPDPQRATPPQPRAEAFAYQRQRYIAYAMAGALLLLAGAGFTLTSWNKTVERHDRELETMVVMGAQAVDTYLSTLEKTLAGLAATTLPVG